MYDRICQRQFPNIRFLMVPSKVALYIPEKFNPAMRKSRLILLPGYMHSWSTHSPISETLTDIKRFKKQGCHHQGKVRKFFKKSGKIFDIVKVSEKTGISVFRFIVHKLIQDFEMHFLSEKTKRMLQSKQSDQFDTLRLTHVVVVASQWFSL